MIIIRNLLRISTSKLRRKFTRKDLVIFSYRQQHILQEFHGRESDKIWPEVKKYLDRVLNEPSARKQAA